MPEQDDNKDTGAPQHVLREAIIPVRLDLSGAMKQIDEMQERIESLGKDKQESINERPKTSGLAAIAASAITEGGQKQDAGMSILDIKILEMAAGIKDIVDLLRELKETIEERQGRD